MQNKIELDKLNYKTKDGKKYNYSKLQLPIVFLRDLYKTVLSIEKTDNEQSNLFKEFTNISNLKNLSLEIIRSLIEVRQNFLDSFKSNVFPLGNSTSYPTPNPPLFYTLKQTRAQSNIPKIEISLFKLNENFVNGIRNDE